MGPTHVSNMYWNFDDGRLGRFRAGSSLVQNLQLEPMRDEEFRGRPGGCGPADSPVGPDAKQGCPLPCFAGFHGGPKGFGFR